MAPEVDPFRTLGVPPGASLNELKSAYRRLVKQYHPDAAGERALPRFLAIQAAYERLVDGEGRLRPQGDRSGGASTPAGRHRASRDAWRARRSSPGTASGGTGSRQRPAGGAADPAGEGSAAAGGSRTRGSGEPGPDGERTRHRRGPRKATPGSTTYDEAAETGRDPEWNGGSWYGPSMGTFWTINPKEYADPRKHGPEYLARARRATGTAPEDARRPSPAEASGRPAPASPADPAEPATAAGDAEGDWAWSGRAQTTTGGDTADWAARSWTYDTREPGPTWTPGTEPRRGRARARAEAPPVADVPPLPDLETLLRRASPTNILARARRGGRRWRLGIAILAWLPIAYATSTVVLDATGCSTYAATCPQEVRVPLLLVQLLVIAGLYALPAVAATGAFGTLAAFAVAIPVAAIFAIGAGPRPTVTSSILNLAMAATWLGAVIGAAWWLWGHPRAPDPGP
jgi:curved DNA-binding protein CbpA